MPCRRSETSFSTKICSLEFPRRQMPSSLWAMSNQHSSCYIDRLAFTPRSSLLSREVLPSDILILTRLPL